MPTCVHPEDVEPRYSVIVPELWSDVPQRIDVTQNDVRQVQLAKAALYAGIRLLQDRAGTDRIDAGFRRCRRRRAMR